MNSATITALAAISGSVVGALGSLCGFLDPRGIRVGATCWEKQPVLEDFSDTCRGELKSMKE